ncbi:MAG TPA: MXAN_6640 family putative metalloprotease [Gemmatimonadaceae bacterium]|nr:MXAN_6640 family putative metalloprotease [Gemmatimonadaceae bacterium]
MHPFTRLFTTLVAGAVVLAACSPDVPSSPLRPDISGPRLAAGGQGNGNGVSALDMIEEDYAAGLLDKENTNKYREYAVSAPDKLPQKYQSSAVGKDATYSMVQMAKDWGSLSAATRKEIRDLRANGFGNLQQTVATTHFVLHYTTQGKWAVPTQDTDHNGVPDFIDESAKSWEAVYTREVGQLGYQAPKLTALPDGSVSNKFHVYFKDMKFYGYTVPENVEFAPVNGFPSGTASAWIVVENDFVGFPPNDEDVTGLETVRTGALKVTQAHEFMHALQFNINVYQSGWLMESHATWAEDAVYDGINDWHWYINSFLATPSLPIFNRYVYGSAFFQNWLSETYGVDTPRKVWQAARSMSAADAIQSVAFGGSWAPFAAFAVDQPMLRISDFTTDKASSIQPNPGRLLRATYSSYPVNVTIPDATKQVSNGAPYGLGANYLEFAPGSSSGSLTLSFDGTDGYAWRVSAIVYGAKGAPTVLPVSLDGGSAGSVVVNGFGTSATRVLLSASIADRSGVQVPYSFSASVAAATVASK